MFNSIWDHHPKRPILRAKIVDSIRNKPSNLTPFFQNLREKDICEAHLICYHYRIISRENSINKLKTNMWYKNDKFSIDDLMNTDYPEIIDETIKYKCLCPKNKNQPVLIHVGKSGGSYIKNILPNLNCIHMRKPPLHQNNVNYILILKNPIERFVSAFYHSKYLVDFDTTGYTYDRLINDKSTPFFKLKNKIKHKLRNNNPFLEWKSGGKYKDLISYFDTANHLAESLTSSDSTEHKKAYELCNNVEVEHIHKGIGWYLHNGKFIETNHQKVIYCKDINTVNEKHLSILLKTNALKCTYSRQNTKGYDKGLSLKAIENIIKFYENTDYRALNKLYEYNLITKQLLDDYRIYKYIK
jgi:hypothetical protein